ncbi:LuxR C-terminal-related transcriptional regulator [Arthrobacter sp. SO3]|uniref:LuxR C-terminal-related transcriptional regulator n=1 Tax=Arthrobacter sp. SO3 TaxID=1897057 RepID=UPI001CFF8E9D|nr:LuxR C-terminal-related transcriptional regulator [Arthrobacter sp. SO3]MCB5292848.1 HTH-type transcriptional regulator MalT [Arthrobacter sp. SO3]
MSAFVPGPQSKTRPPLRGLGALERPRLGDALTVATDAHRLTVITAPAGYGKSTFLGDWARTTDLPCAWLSLDRFDAQPARLFHGVVGAIQAAACQLPLPGNSALLALEQGLADDCAVSYDVLLGALEQLTEPIALVIDDFHLAGLELAGGIVGVLAASAPPTLRMILSGRGHPPIQLERHRFGEGLGELCAAELAFTQDEVAQVACSLGQDASFDAGPLWELTDGWPVAVHASLTALAQARNLPGRITHTPPENLPLSNYIAEEVLEQLDPQLADFVLRATTCEWLGRRLAVELHGQPDGGLLLETCLRNGLFIEELEYCGGESMYRWHSLFAAQCRRILERRDPLLAERLHRVAARYYQDTDVCEGVNQALQGHAPRQAVMSIGRHWLEFLLRNGPPALEQLCLDLPAPWSEDSEMLMVRSVCRALDGDNDGASELSQRALSRTSELDSVRRGMLEGCRSLLEPLPVASRLDPRPPADDGGPLPDFPAEGHPATYSTALFLVAQAEFRLHRTGYQATVLLESAVDNRSDMKLEEAEIFAKAELALAYAVAGDLVTADELATLALEWADELDWSSQDRMAAAWLARGIACYWRDELKGARAHLAKALRLGTKLSTLGAVCVVYRILVDCATGDESHLADSGNVLDAFHDRGLYGVSWNAFHTIARAKIAEAGGDVDGALAIVQPLGSGGHAPLVDTLLAELLRRGGEVSAAERCARELKFQHRNRYLDTSISLTEALLAHGKRDEATTHERIEHAVRRAEPQSILRPFAERTSELAELLIRHAVWGTTHESFIAARMARHAKIQPHLRTRSYWTLTDREREVLAYMRSVMTAAEIAEALFISVNTVKTHERSIYRKLGAAGRRDALKTAAERGIV